jgi:hypothetical protein
MSAPLSTLADPPSSRWRQNHRIFGPNRCPRVEEMGDQGIGGRGLTTADAQALRTERQRDDATRLRVLAPGPSTIGRDRDASWVGALGPQR